MKLIKNVANVLLVLLLLLDIVFLVIFAFRTQFMIDVDATTGVVRDGLGRVLSEPPFYFLEYFYVNNWAGWKWFFIDYAVLAVTIYIPFLIVNVINKLNSRKEN